jgi:3-keto-disaccharide hydrolase
MSTLRLGCFFCLALAAGVCASAADAPAARDLFNGKDLSGWKLRNPKASNSKWEVVSNVKLADGMPARFAAQKGDGILLNSDDGRGVDLLTETEHGDCELSIEFNVPKGSNSGVYFQGQYEVQVFDSYGKKDAELKYGDCGGIYNTTPPKANASKAPGEWQKFEVVFQAPRFDAQGKKTANAKFVKVVHNGVLIHENVEVKGPTTAALGGPEQATGPLMLQGDHGPVAFRNIRIKPLK